MQVWDQVKVKTAKAGEGEEHVGRAGVVTKITGAGDDEVCTVRLDENETHESGEDDYPTDHLEFLGR